MNYPSQNAFNICSITSLCLFLSFMTKNRKNKQENSFVGNFATLRSIIFAESFQPCLCLSLSLFAGSSSQANFKIIQMFMFLFSVFLNIFFPKSTVLWFNQHVQYNTPTLDFVSNSLWKKTCFYFDLDPASNFYFRLTKLSIQVLLLSYFGIRFRIQSLKNRHIHRHIIKMNENRTVLLFRLFCRFLYICQ